MFVPAPCLLRAGVLPSESQKSRWGPLSDEAFSIPQAHCVTRERGQFVESPLGMVMATVHPSSILRAPDDEARKEQLQGFVNDLRKVARFVSRDD